jgi:hypothetical protein
MLARGHGLSLTDGYRRDRTHAGWAVAGWLVAAWQLTVGLGIGVAFGYALAGSVLVGLLAWLFRRWRLPGRVVLADAVGTGLMLGVVAVAAYPYLHLYPELRKSAAGDLAALSPPVQGLLVAPADSLLWGGAHATIRGTLAYPGEMALLPGFALLGLAVAGVFFSAWSVRARILLTLGAAATAICALGTHGPLHGWIGFRALAVLPGFDVTRTPGRLIAWTVLLLAILAAGAVTAFARRGAELLGDRVPGRPEVLLRLATLVPLAVVLAEGVNTLPHPVVPQPPAGFTSLTGPLLVLPAGADDDQLYLLWSTRGLATLVNGTGPYQPPRRMELLAGAAAFPDAGSVEALRGAGVRTVVVLRDPDEPAPTDDDLVSELGITREEQGEMLVYHLAD